MSPFVADIVGKVENRTTLKISRKSIFGLSAAGPLFSGTTEVRDRFWMKRYGPSRRRAENASVALRIFVRHPKKTFATISANRRLMHRSKLHSLFNHLVSASEKCRWHDEAE